MSFIDLEFLLFFPVVLILFYKLPSYYRPYTILLSSIFMYGYYRIDFLVLLLITTLADFYLALMIDRAARYRKFFMLLSVSVNLFILFIFKYYNFFVIDVFQFISPKAKDFIIPDIVLPLGISFYTFHAISYLIDVYRGRIKATKDIISYFNYILFFPQLVAGPISRCSQLLSQLTSSKFLNAKFVQQEVLIEAFWLILWGFFLKVVIADNIAHVVDIAFKNPPSDLLEVILSGSLFSIQIYADFFGYSLIAIGLGKIFLVDLPSNFDHPYMSKNIIEFWRRWHITLGTWIRDYVYIPLGGNQGSRIRRVCTPLIVFAIFGLWHGAQWNFLIWGIVNGLLLALNHFLRDFPIYLKPPPRLIAIFFTYLLVCLTWVIFRAPNLDYLFKAFLALAHIGYKEYYLDYLWAILVYSLPIVLIEYYQLKQNTLYIFNHFGKVTRGAVWGLMIFLIIIYFPVQKSSNFIYFQF